MTNKSRFAYRWERNFGVRRKWQNISANQNNYLIQVMPPGDIMPFISQLVVPTLNMTNAAILYDDSFSECVQSVQLLRRPNAGHLALRALGRFEKNELDSLLAQCTNFPKLKASNCWDVTP